MNTAPHTALIKKRLSLSSADLTSNPINAKHDQNVPQLRNDGRPDNVGAALNNVRSILENSANAMQFTPIPGLEAALSAIASFIGVIEKTRENDDLRDKVLQNIGSLRDTLVGTLDQVKAPGISDLDHNTADPSYALQPSPELKQRLHTLLTELEMIGSKVKKMSQGNFLKRMWFSRSNAERLKDLDAAIGQAKNNFTMQSELVREIYTRGIYELQAYDHRQRNRSKDQETLQRLPHTESAGYRHAVHLEKSRFLIGTRKDVFRDVERWLATTPENQRTSFFVLMGEAGTGKSTVAYEIAKRLDKNKLLGGSFFFARDVPALNNAQTFFTTIARQLARYHESFFVRIVDGAYSFLEQGVHQQMEYQLEQLISQPLHGLHISQPPIIVIDAVDECTDFEIGYASRGVEMLKLLIAAFRNHTLPIRIILTSRPDFGILEVFESREFDEIGGMHHLHEFSSGTAHADISLYLHERFKEISFRNQLLQERPSTIDELAHRSEGLFIYAATVVGLLKNSGPPSNTLRVLATLLSEDTHNNHSHLSRLDKLYLTVMRTAFIDIQDPDGRAMVQPVLGLIPTLKDRLPLKHVAILTGLPLEDILFILQHIRSVLSLGPNETGGNDVMVPLHATFPQFLTDSTRCIDAEYFIDPLEHHHKLATACFRLLVNGGHLHRNICNLADPLLRKIEILDLADRVSRAIPPHVLYACMNWVEHLSNGKIEEEVLGLFESFCHTQLLTWLEAMSFADCLDRAAFQLQCARRWYRNIVMDTKIAQTSDSTSILELLYDAHNLLLEYRPVLETCPNHIYISVLHMIPNGRLSEVYSEVYSDGISARMLTRSGQFWKPHAQKHVNHALGTKSILFSRFSHDGSKLLCLPTSKSPFHILDVISRNDRTFALAAETAYCGCFSPDDKLVAVALRSAGPTSIQIWHISTGKKLIYSRATSHIQDMTFSTDGVLLAAVDGHNHLCVWNVEDGRRIDPKSVGPCCWDPSSLFSSKRSMSFSGKTITVSDLASGVIFKHTVSNKDDRIVDYAALAPDGQNVIFSDGRRISKWNVEARTFRSLKSGWKESPTNISRTRSAAFSPKGNTVAIILLNYTVATYDLSSGRWLGNFGKGERMGPAITDCILFSPDGIQLISVAGQMAGQSAEIQLYFWDLTPFTTSHPSRSITRAASGAVKSSKITYIFFSPDKTYCAALADDHSLTVWKIWEGNSEVYRGLGTLPERNIGRAQFSLDSTLIIFKRSLFSDAEERLDLRTSKLTPVGGSRESLNSEMDQLYPLPDLQPEYGVDHNGWVISLTAKRRLFWLPDALNPFQDSPASQVTEEGDSDYDVLQPKSKDIRFDKYCIASRGDLLAISVGNVLKIFDLHDLIGHCKKLEESAKEKRRERIMASGANASITIANKKARDLISLTR